MKLILICILILLTTLSQGRDPGDPYLSPSSLDFDETYQRLYIATGAAGKVLIFDIASKQLSNEIELPGSANGICHTSDYIFVASGGYNGNLYKIDAGSLEILDSIQVGHTPVSPIFSDGYIYVCNRFSCASCHPDARTDGLNWDLGNDGYGTLRQTKSHLFSHITPPSIVREGPFQAIR